MLLALLLCALPADEVWAPVYQAAGVEAARAGVDLDWMETFGGGLYRNPHFLPLMRDPLRVPPFAEVTGRGLLADAASPGRLVYRATALAGWGVRRGLVEPIAQRLRARLDANRPLAAALARLREVAGMPGLAGNEPETDDLPRELQESVALILLAVAEFPQWLTWAFEGTPAAGLATHLNDLRRAVAPDRELEGAALAEHERRVDRLIASLDLPALSAGGGDILLVLEDVLPALREVDLAGIDNRRWATPLGDIILAGHGDDVHQGEPPLLLIDAGGNDRYSTGAAALTENRPVSILIDLDGADTYAAPADSVGTWAAAIGGVAVLIDIAGDDSYAGRQLTQGAAIAGLALLWDGGGDDTYEAVDHAQGSGVYGVGVLADQDGNDQYHAVQYSQGYGFTLGAGVLIDAAGNDRYDAEDEEITAPSPQSAEHNANLSQGFGYGRRADYTNGHGTTGGVGWLCDGAGDDVYSCGVFGQGGGYWYGIGGLTDFAGDDQYTGVWYVQGAAAHFALGLLLDADGADRYTATMNMAQGAGHDFSLGWLADLAGDDRYTAPNLSLGAGNANGAGYFIESAGNDTYTAADGLNLGRARTAPVTALATSTRRWIRTLGFFLDLAGRDTYPRGECADGRSWRYAEEGTGAQGAGVDR